MSKDNNRQDLGKDSIFKLLIKFSIANNLTLGGKYVKR